MGNYAAFKKYTQKEKNQFILLTRSHFSLIAKNCVGLGTQTLGCIPSAAVAVRGCLPREVSARGKVCLPMGEGCLPMGGGVCPGGCLPGWGAQCILGYTVPPVNRITDACENITLPRLCCGR